MKLSGSGRIFAGAGFLPDLEIKSAGFRPEPESGTALFKSFKPSGQETDLSYSTATGALSSRNVQCAKYM